MSESQRWVIDAIEEHVASIELPDGKMIQLPASILPKGAKRGQIVFASRSRSMPRRRSMRSRNRPRR